MLRRIHDPDRGASFVEYAAVIALVVAVAAAFFMSGLPRIINDGISRAVSDALDPNGTTSVDVPRTDSELPESGQGDSGVEGSAPKSGDPGSGDLGDNGSDDQDLGGGGEGAGEPIKVDPAPYIPEEDGGTISSAPLDSEKEFVVSDVWSPQEEWESIKTQPWFTFEDNGNYDWYCGQVLYHICKFGGGIAQGANDIAEDIRETSCLAGICGKDEFKEGWGNIGEGAKNLWNDPLGTLGEMWDSLPDKSDENYHNNGTLGGFSKNLGLALTEFIGAPLKPLKFFGNGGTSGRGDDSDRGRQGGCDNSFVPGTLVLLADGNAKPIELVSVGDRVLAHDPETGEQGPREVTQRIVGGGAKILVDVTVTDGSGDTGSVTATDNHPFWVLDQGWTDAIDLEPGSWLRTSVGVWVQVEGVDVYTVAEQVVHNLTVADLHTYYALMGEIPVLSHNADCEWQENSKESISSARQIVDDGDWQHVVDRHRPGGKNVDPESSIFRGKNNQVKNRIAEAVYRGTPRKNTHDPETGEPRSGWVYEWDFGNVVGVSGSANGGGELTAIRVVVSDDGKMITAFPV